jgi:hypothetical protein
MAQDAPAVAGRIGNGLGRRERHGMNGTPTPGLVCPLLLLVQTVLHAFLFEGDCDLMQRSPVVSHAVR